MHQYVIFWRLLNHMCTIGGHLGFNTMKPTLALFTFTITTGGTKVETNYYQPLIGKWVGKKSRKSWSYIMVWNQFWRSILIFVLMRFCNVYFFNFIEYNCTYLMWNMSASKCFWKGMGIKIWLLLQNLLQPIVIQWTTYNTVWSLVSNSESFSNK